MKKTETIKSILSHKKPTQKSNKTKIRLFKKILKKGQEYMHHKIKNKINVISSLILFQSINLVGLDFALTDGPLDLLHTAHRTFLLL